MKKKLISMLSVLMCILICFTACGADLDQYTETEEAETEEIEIEETETEEIEETETEEIESEEPEETETEESETENVSDSVAETLSDNEDNSEPVEEYDGIMFETRDIDGNIVTSEELFSKYDVTMVNVWATWCYWCVMELPELEKLNNKLSGKNCVVIGLLGDGEDKQTIAYAKELMQDAGCDYLCLLPFEGWEDIFIMDEGWPTSFFINSKGEMVGEPVIGAAVDMYEECIDSILEETGSDKTASQNVTGNDENVYRIYVVDQYSNPVVGAKVQFCTSDTCKIGTTDETGAAVFDDPEGIYQVHVLKAPKGYKVDDTVLETPDRYGDMTIVLRKKMPKKLAF